LVISRFGNVVQGSFFKKASGIDIAVPYRGGEGPAPICSADAFTSTLRQCRNCCR
jgi:hypothetical protein